MNGLALLLAASALGVDYGWRPLEEGGLEYIIQIEPEVFASLEKGGDILSEIHPEAQDVRRFRIRIGRGPLPREGGVVMLANANDGPLPPAPPGDLTPDAAMTRSADAKSSSATVGERTLPPANHLAQGSGYGSPFGGYSGSYTRTGSPSGAATGGAAPSSVGAGDYGSSGTAGRTTGDYSATRPAYSGTANTGSTGGGYSEYRSGGGSGASAASGATTGPAAGSSGEGGADSGWSRGEVRTASNQQPAANSGAQTEGATSRSTATQNSGSSNAETQNSSSQGSASQGSTSGTGGNSTSPTGSSSQTAAGNSSQQTQTPGGYGGYSSPAQPPATSGDVGVTPLGSNLGQQAGVGNWANSQVDNRNPPPPAYSPPQGYAAGAAYANQQNPGQPPLLAPPSQAPGNYGYAPAGAPGYPYPQSGAGYGYAPAPGYYGAAPPALTTAANTEPSSRSRSRDDEEDDDRDRRARSAPAPAQGTIVGTEPWLAFTVTILLLFASVGGNIYLLWISQDFYWRYKELAGDIRTLNSAQ